MSNQCHLISTMFVDTKDGSMSHGFRMFSDYAKTYTNCMERSLNDDMALLEAAYVESETNSVIEELLDFHATGLGDGMFINDTWYDVEQLRAAIKKIRDKANSDV